MRILVTGASGFVGSALLRHLAPRPDLALRAALRTAASGGLLPAGVEVVETGDLGPQTNWHAALTGIDTVVHCAARVHVMNETAGDPLSLFRRVNVEGSLALARQARDAGVKRLVFLSSIKVNGEQTAPGHPFTADDTPAPVDAYGISKMEAEQALMALAAEGGMEVVVIRPVLVNQPALAQRAEIIREKGTDRSRFFRGEVDKYTWQEVGSSFLPGELIAAFLWAQLEGADAITDARLAAWHRYDEQLAQAEQDGLLRRPVVPDGCVHNAHMYYVIVPQAGQRQQVLDALKQEGIGAVFHYVPLHSSPAGLRYGRVSGALDVTDQQSERLIRLPLWAGLTVQQQDKVIDILTSTLKASRS